MFNHTTPGPFPLQCGICDEVSKTSLQLLLTIVIKCFNSGTRLQKEANCCKLHDMGSKENLPLTAIPLFETCVIPTFNTMK